MDSVQTSPPHALAGLLPLPERAAKPRAVGITHVVDPGLTRVEAVGLMEIAAAHVDVVRLGWGSALVTGALEAKLAAYREHDVAPMLGGTLTELAWRHGRVDALCEALRRLDIRHVEVSEGTLDLPPGEKRRLIRSLADEFTVFVEVGSKDGRLAPSGELWIRQASEALEAGAQAVICEGRVSGDAGLYWPDGSIRDELVSALVGAAGVERLIFEAPRRSQQAWLVRHFGPDVNLGNILPWDLIAVESLRLGLRSDTLTRFHGVSRPAVLLTGVGKRYDIVSAFAQHAFVVAADPSPLAPAQYAADVRVAPPGRRI